MLLQDSRVSYRELAEVLGLSVNSVHKRIQNLIEEKIIRGFKTSLSQSFLNILSVLIYGTTKQSSLNSIQETLRNDRQTYWLGVGSGNELYVGAYLQNLSDLEDYVRHVQNVTQIQNPNVGIVSFDSGIGVQSGPERTLTKLDYRIIKSMQTNSRKPLTDVADELGVSAKTVRRRIDYMVENHDVEFTIDWYPEMSNDIISILHVSVDPGIDRYEVAGKVLQNHSPNLLFFWAFSNIPNQLLLWSWTDTMRTLSELQKDLEKVTGIQSVVASIIYTGEIFSTWRDHVLESRI